MLVPKGQVVKEEIESLNLSGMNIVEELERRTELGAILPIINVDGPFTCTDFICLTYAPE
jgi:hypothetical protein